MRRRAASLLSSSAALALALGDVPAAAQAPPTNAAAALAPVPPAAPSAGDSAPPSAFLLTSPIRLALEGTVAPVGGAFPNCASREEPAGSSVGGIPVQRSAAMEIAPGLILSGFTQLGCPIDAGIGGSLTYALPLTDSLSLRFGAGIYAAPGQLPLSGLDSSLKGLQTALLRGLRGARSPLNAVARIDLAWSAPGGRLFTAGVQSLGRTAQQVVLSVGY